MVQKDLILDFNLYLCEKFGYRESCTSSTSSSSSLRV